MNKRVLQILTALSLLMPFRVAAEEEPAPAEMPVVESISFTVDEIVVDGSKFVIVDFVTVPENIPPSMLTVSTSDASICAAAVQEGGINLVTESAGTTTITVMAPNGVKDELQVIVNDVKPEKVEFVQDEFEIGQNNTVFLKWELMPENAFCNHLEIVSDESIARTIVFTESHLRIETVGEGTTEMKVLCDGDEIGSAIIHSVYKPLEDFTFGVEEYTSAPGMEYTTLELVPNDASQHEFTIESSDPEVVIGEMMDETTVRLTLKKMGSAVLTVSCAGITKTLPINVIGQPVESLMFITPLLNIATDSIMPAPMLASPADADTTTVTYTSTDEEVARVVGSMLPFMVVIESCKEGTAVITATAESGVSASITVISVPVEASDIVDLEEINLNTNEKMLIKYILTPSLPSRSEYSFVSDNPDVCRIEYIDYSYYAVGVSPGTATITLTLKNGRSESCTVTVTDPAACKVFGFCTYEGKQYWFEDGKRQGTYGDPLNVADTQFGEIERGREIYDPDTDAWYWLDALYEGAAAVDKEVWMPYVFQGDDSAEGKWVRYDSEGKMIKGWYDADETVYPDQKGNTYYYDPLTGAMAKGKTVIEGSEYSFDELTGALIR